MLDSFRLTLLSEFILLRCREGARRLSRLDWKKARSGGVGQGRIARPGGRCLDRRRHEGHEYPD